jgi:hypothetical protein
MKSLPLILSITLCSLSLHAADPDWKAAASKVVITPKDTMWMAGYSSRNKPAEGAAQDLFAKALALQDTQGNRFVVVTMDLIGVPRTLRDDLVKRLGETQHLPAESVLFNASHTHCGPEYRFGGVGADSPEIGRRQQADAYGVWLEEALFKLVGDALAHLAPAQVTYHHARCGYAMNRRLPIDGTFRNSPYPDGPVDQDVPVLRVTGADGKEMAILFGYACHNTTLPFYQWCGDHAGYAQEYIEAAHPGAIALYMQGCGGDQNPYPRGKIELAKMHGQSLATAVDAALTATSQAIHGPLKENFADADIDFAHVPTRAELDEQAQSKNGLDASHAKKLLARLDAGETLPAHYAYPVQVVRFGDGLTFVGLAGETVVDYSLRLKRELAGGPVWVAGYCNDVMTYIPTRRVLEEGGYEGVDAIKFTALPGPWAPTIEERIVGKVHDLVRSMAR